MNARAKKIKLLESEIYNYKAFVSELQEEMLETKVKKLEPLQKELLRLRDENSRLRFILGTEMIEYRLEKMKTQPNQS